MEWLPEVEFQYNDKRHIVTEYTPFKLNFGRYLMKRNLTINMELSKLNDFLKGLQKSQEKTKILMDIAKEAIKRQFNKKRINPQELKCQDCKQWTLIIFIFIYSIFRTQG